MLWQKNGGPPGPLPAWDATPDGAVMTDLVRNPDGRAACGYTEAPEPPAFDAAKQQAVWIDGAWAIVSIVPTEISMLQLELELLARGLRPAALAAIATAGDEADIRWRRSDRVHRQHPMVLELQALTTWSDELVDEIATAAAQRT